MLCKEADDIANLKIFRWWTLCELANSSEHFAPENLYNHLKELVELGVPSTPINVGI